MLTLVIASLGLATFLLVAALVEMFYRWAVEFFEQRASNVPPPRTYDSDFPFSGLRQTDKLEV